MQWVVVTGLGAVTPLAAGVEASWSRHLPGRSGIQTHLLHLDLLSC